MLPPTIGGSPTDMQLALSKAGISGEYPLVEVPPSASSVTGSSQHSQQQSSPLSRHSDLTMVSRMYENTGNHYQSIKDIESDTGGGAGGHYMSTPFCQQQPHPSIASQSNTDSSMFEQQMRPGSQSKLLTNGALLDAVNNENSPRNGIPSSIVGRLSYPHYPYNLYNHHNQHHHPTALHYPLAAGTAEESDYFSQCSSDGGCGAMGSGGGGEGADGGVGATYHFDLCRNPITAVDSCSSHPCDHKSCATDRHLRSEQQFLQ